MTPPALLVLKLAGGRSQDFSVSRDLPSARFMIGIGSANLLLFLSLSVLLFLFLQRTLTNALGSPRPAVGRPHLEEASEALS